MIVRYTLDTGLVFEMGILLDTSLRDLSYGMPSVVSVEVISVEYLS
jgi:hypothetical protein